MAGVEQEIAVDPVDRATVLDFRRERGRTRLTADRSLVREDVGWDLSLGVRWRPLLTDNIIVNLGGAAFIGGDGFKDIYQSQQFVFGPNGLEKQSSQKTQTLYSAFLSVTLTF